MESFENFLICSVMCLSSNDYLYITLESSQDMEAE